MIRPTIGRLVKVFSTMAGSPATTARVQELLSVQFSYSRPDDENLLGICRYDGDWEYDIEAEKLWKKSPKKSIAGEPGCEDQPGTELVDRPWLQSGRRRRKASYS